MRYASLALGLALAAPFIASAAPRAAEDTPPRVIKRPDAAALTAAWAALGKTRSEQGRAVAHCKVSATGVVSDCSLVREYPSGLGLGALLLAVAPRFVVSPATHEGQPVASEIFLENDTFAFDTQPDWLKKPTPEDILAVYPTEAMRRGIGGEATLSCIVSLQGALFDCYVPYEQPAGASFGAAALALTPQLLMKPARLKGQPVLAPVRIPINFRTYGGADPSPNARKVVSAAMVWAAAPTYAEMAAAYPAKARDARVGGHATLFCEFNPSGGLTQCSTVSEEPTGRGFATAAMKLSHSFRVTVTPADAKALRTAAVQVPFTFDPAMLSADPQVIGKPQWAAGPGPDDVIAAFAATPKNVGTVRVMLSCTVQPAGYVSGCSVESETPPGKGFGQAALALTPKFRLATWTVEGLPVVGGTVRMPIRYESGEPAPAKP